MKFKFIKAAVTGIILSVSSLANAGLISSSEYSLESINGPFHGGFNNYSTARDINNVTELNAVDAMLSDGAVNLISGSNGISYTSQTTPIGTFTGIYTAYDSGSLYELIYSFDGSAPRLFNGFSMESSRAEATMFNSSLSVSLDGTNWTEVSKGTVTTVTNNGVDTGSFSFTGVVANYVKYSTTRRNGSIHEIALFEETVDVPEPSTLAIIALGLMGLASRRFKKKS
jgi:hypothetical protein